MNLLNNMTHYIVFDGADSRTSECKWMVSLECFCQDFRDCARRVCKELGFDSIGLQGVQDLSLVHSSSFYFLACRASSSFDCSFRVGPYWDHLFSESNRNALILTGAGSRRKSDRIRRQVTCRLGGFDRTRSTAPCPQSFSSLVI